MKRSTQFCFLALIALTPWQSKAACPAPHTSGDLIAHVRSCIGNAEKGVSKIDNPEIFDIPGMSGRNVQHFLNNLCSLPNASYLEIGVWKGSTLVSALYRNTSVQAIAIDSWADRDQGSFFKRWAKKVLSSLPVPSLKARYGDPQGVFIANVDKYLSVGSLQFYESDCFALEKDKIFKNPVNIYFYDGNHEEINHEKAFTFFDSILDKTFIAVVDDWNWPEVRRGTFAAFDQLGYKVKYSKEWLTEKADKATWWNGLYVAVIERPGSTNFHPNRMPVQIE